MLNEHDLDDFKARLARREERKAAHKAEAAAAKAQHRPLLTEDAEGYFLILGVLYGGSAALFSIYCMFGNPGSMALIESGDLEYATLRYFGGFWLYLFAPIVLFSLGYGVSKTGPTANALRAFGLASMLVSVSVRGLLYLFGG